MKGWNVVNDLADVGTPLTSGLLKLMVVLKRMGDDEGAAWVQKELQGYNPDEDVPEYRKQEGRVMGEFLAGATIQRRAIPLGEIIGSEKAEPWERPGAKEGIEELEGLVTSSKGSGTGLLEVAAGPQLLNLYERQLSSWLRVGAGGMDLGNANCVGVRVEIGISQITGVLGAIRVRALNAAMELENMDPRVVGADVEEAQQAVKERGREWVEVAKAATRNAIHKAAETAGATVVKNLIVSCP